MARTMKAIYHGEYGSFDDLRLTDIEVPQPRDNEVLVRVHAAGLHVGDCFGVRGSPLLMRIESGWRKPKYGVPGFDVAGTVEAIGSQVHSLQPGDEVFGCCSGSCAEFAVANEKTLSHKPASVPFSHAASLPTSGLAALHAMRDVAKVQPDQHVLVIGASGGVGSFAIQIAKALGAIVTGVCSGANSDAVGSLGADHVIVYDREDFTQSETRYDVIFDNIENRTLAESRRVLKPSGTMILNSGTGAQGLAMMVRLIRPLFLSPWTRQNLRRYLSVPNHDDLDVLMNLVESQQIRPLIGRTFPLAETPEALRHIDRGHAKGKTIIDVIGHTSSAVSTQARP